MPSWLRVKEVLGLALDLPPDRRPALLDTLCAGEPELRAEVESLLEADSAAGPFYDALASEFGLSIDGLGPHFGSDHLMDVVAESADVASFVGVKPRLAWPNGHDLRRIPVVDPTPVYPHSLVWRTENAHPALALLRGHLGAPAGETNAVGSWTPA